jgi:prepilin-type N-terminal cleavage/methylation domain-containing protein
MLVHTRCPRNRRAGFTLLELVVVIMIIASIAGLVIPQLGMIGRSSDMAMSAKTQADLANNLQVYFVLQKRFPTGMDSLLVGDGTAAPTAVFLPETDVEGNQITGLPDSGPHLDEDLEMVDLATLAGGDWARSFTRSGFEFVYDHDNTVQNANDSAKATTARALSTSECVVAKLIDGAELTSRIMPNGVLKPDTILVAVGVGPNNDMRSKTLTNSPIYPGCDGSYYGRYVAIFKVYANGERASLVAVVDSYGRDPDYTQQQFVESLPDDSRRG